MSNQYRPASETLEIWNGGLPPVLQVGEGREALRSVPSDRLPLGIVGEHDFDGATVCTSLHEVAHLILYSDGLVEAQNAHGHVFGESGLEEALALPCSASTLLDAIKTGIIEFLDGLEPHDDISLLSICLEGGK